MPQNPLTTMLNAQRIAIEQSQVLTHDALEAQTASLRAAADAVESSEGLLEQNATFARDAFHAYVDAVEANLPDEAGDFEDVHALVDEQFDAATEVQRQSLEVLVEAIEESGAVYEEFATGYASVVDSSFDAYLDAHEQVEANVDHLAETVEDVADDFETAV